jgi:flagellar biosynthesis/type III secretory pathway protein FliH
MMTVTNVAELDEAYEEGFHDGINHADKEYDRGYEDAKQQGYEDGLDEGYALGFEEGYTQGLSDATNVYEQ